MSFEQGQLYVVPFGEQKRDVLFMVNKVKPNGKAHLLAHVGIGTVEITTRTSEPGDDWVFFDNDEAVGLLRGGIIEHNMRAHPPEWESA